MAIQLHIEGRRTYFLGDTYPVRDRIHALGAHWDGDRKAWWTSKRAEAEALAVELNSAHAGIPQDTRQQSRQQTPGESATVAGKATYKGKTYYLAGRVNKGRTHYDDTVSAVRTRDGSKYLLYFRDGSSQFWAAASEVQIVKHYSGRPQTIRGLQKFAKELRESGETPELLAARRRGWDGVIGSPSYYSSGAFDELDM